jgi:GR25 family glycosyltransferase involved in LPS biosynthesis
MLSPALRNFHDGVFVVTAPGFEDRQLHMRRVLGEGNFEFVLGINKSETSKEKLIADGSYDESRAIELDRSGKPMTLGHICCSISHANVYRHICKNNIKTALIFEDDAVAMAVDEATVEDIVAKVPDDAELIYWGWKSDAEPPHAGLKKWLYKRQHDLGLLSYSHTMIDNLFPSDFNDHFYRAGKTFLAHSYTVTLEAARKLLEWNTPVVLNADNALMYAVLNGDVRAYLSKRQLFGQRSQVVGDQLHSHTQS